MASYELRGATLIDGSGAVPLPSSRVVVDGERIRSVGTRDAGAVDEVIDLRGKILLPGLVNSHDHLTMKGLLTMPGLDRKYYELYRQPADYQLARTFRGALICLAEGQTTVRDAGGMDQLAIVTRRCIDSGMLVGPRVVTCGSPISIPYDGADVKPAGMTVDAEGPDAVGALARRLLDEGADYIKMKGHRRDFEQTERTRLFSRAELAAAVAAAHERGRMITFHAWYLPIIEAAIELGADAVEHANPLADDPDLARRMAERGIFLVPNVLSWNKTGVAEPGRNERSGIAVERVWESTRAAIAAGVRLGVGTDLHTDSMVDEMLVLVRLGLTPMAAIVAATRNGAEIVGNAEIGRVTAGTLADLIVVDGDPLTDLNVLRAPVLVIKGGVRHDPVALRAAIGPSPIVHFPA